ncbi:MAG: glycoside hydrolase family 16 protein [bacterium]
MDFKPAFNIAARFLLLFSIIAVCLSAITAAEEAPKRKDYFPILPEGKKLALVWNDEFDGDRLDETKWEVPEGVRRDGWWRRDAVKLDGKGNLAIFAFKDGDKYIDGCVRTRGKFEHGYGYYVARVQLQKRQGHWSAFWLYNSSVGNIGSGGEDGAEIDIYEKPSLDVFVNHAIHWDGYGEYHKSAAWRSVVPGIQKGFHTFALLWTQEEYVFYVDGKETWRTTAGGPCRVPLYIKLSDEIGDWAGDIAKAELPDYFLVDYVRVYDVVDK